MVKRTMLKRKEGYDDPYVDLSLMLGTQFCGFDRYIWGIEFFGCGRAKKGEVVSVLLFENCNYVLGTVLELKRHLTILGAK